MKPKLLIVDDGDRHTELAHKFLREYRYATRCELPGPCWSCEKRRGCTLTHAHDLKEAEAALQRHEDIDAVLLDVAFDLPADRLAPSSEPNLERRRRLQGLEILTHLRRRRENLPVVLMTSKEELAGESLSDEFVALAGADAFDARALGLLIERVLAERRSVAAAGDYQWGRSTLMARLRRDAMALSRTGLPILILGETGTGKSALAERVLHPASGRTGPFIAVDLASIPPTLAAAELFGSARGAFSGAVDRPGRIEAAHGGTLFLDEIGNLPAEAQRMLLLALEDGRITRLGETAPRRADFKLIAATNGDLTAAVDAGSFRGDLYARLNPAASLRLPSLRERLQDLEDLLSAFVQATFARGPDRRLLLDYGEAAHLPGPLEVSLSTTPPVGVAKPRGITFVLPRASLSALRAHSFAGNIRELKLVAATAAVLALSDALEAAQRGAGAIAAAPSVIPIPQQLIARLLQRDSPARRLVVELKQGKTLHEVARNLERQIYQRLFDENGGDFARMAVALLGEEKAARRVRLRFNQLGLRVRKK